MGTDLADPSQAYFLGYIKRDAAIQHYNCAFYRELRVRRVLVLDLDARIALLTTPQRVLATWFARSESSTDSPISFFHQEGTQKPIPNEKLDHYRELLQTGRTSATIQDDTLKSSAQPSAGGVPIIISISARWAEMFVRNMGDESSDTACITDKIGIVRQASFGNSFVLLLKECEADVALGSPALVQNRHGAYGDRIIQFRNGYGAKWNAPDHATTLMNPLYSPTHLEISQVDTRKVWIVSG